ncbi:penicillin-binding transpeptidase domain-containing protein [Desmospora activa]|uniref:Penicillin-binding protein n=1 Tax=Desmospora activa DSM 45169 TaxID=1121389 RepID=A0A2T4Z8G6_9BACL|nr:penicillin-binding transpeptidase domain-containing protein [Desmospora activa]PTM58193.1 penicillin-binding protein [Desmospora activa DSM 45169]
MEEQPKGSEKQEKTPEELQKELAEQKQTQGEEPPQTPQEPEEEIKIPDQKRKNRKWWWIGGAVAILCIAVGGTIFALDAMSGSTPQRVMQQYFNHWEKEQYDQMYALTSEETKQSVDKKSFIKRHEDFAKTLKQESASFTMKTPADEKAETIDFSGIYKTKDIGEISFENKGTLVSDEEGWRLQWSPSLIHPDLEEGGQVKVIQTPPGRRGEIKDRKGDPLAANRERVAIGYIPSQVKDRDQTIQALNDAFALDPEKLTKEMVEAEKEDPFQFVTVKTVEGTELKQVKEWEQLPGISVRDNSLRHYPQKDLTAHVTGYIRPITDEQLEKRKKDGYEKGDWIGQSGLELYLEERLRGEPGWRTVIVDADSKEKTVFSQKESTDGEDIQVTIDLSTQRQLYRGIQQDKGGGVALDPATGEVLAMVSAPSYDPNKFIQGMSQAEWQYLSGPDQPLANRAKIPYSPGSTMKSITSAIALETGAITPDTSYNTDEGKWQKNTTWGGYFVTRVDNPGGGVDLAKGMAWSDNIYFARVGLEIGEQRMIEFLKKFGFDEEMDIPLGVSPSQYSNDKKLENEILLADTAYGQGQLLISPLHLATMYTTFANEGSMVKPQIIMEDGKVTPEMWKENIVSVETANKVKDLLEGVVTQEKGSARDLRTDGVWLGAKTGTAELKASKDDENQRQLGWLAWMAGKESPDKQPDIVVAMMVDEVQDRGGSHYIFPAVKQMLKERY